MSQIFNNILKNIVKYLMHFIQVLWLNRAIFLCFMSILFSLKGKNIRESGTFSISVVYSLYIHPIFTVVSWYIHSKKWFYFVKIKIQCLSAM